MSDLKHIGVNEKVYNKLTELKPHPRASFNEVIEKLIENNKIEKT